MEEHKVTPKKAAQKYEVAMPASPVIHRTPLKQCKLRQASSSYQSSVSTFTVLTNHMTPPSGLTKFITRNPFDADLTNRLHMSVISPTVFSKVSPKNHDSPFAWTIDELAIMKPAKIEEFPMQQAHCTDPEIEMKAQEAINKFFSQNSIHPSPWNDKKEPLKPLICTTPSRKIDGLNVHCNTSKNTKDCWSQTVLSLPPELPKHVEDALMPYFTFTQDQNVDNDDANSSNSSLRRKLFFNHDDSSEEECSLILSPIRGDSSPPQSGMFAHGTPLTKGMLSMQRTYGTPSINSANLSPPNMSPICTAPGDISCRNNGLRYRSATRLDFSTHMSIDASFTDDKENNKSKEGSDRVNETECVENSSDHTKTIANGTIEMVSLSNEITPDEQVIEENYDILKLKDAVHWYKSVSNDNDNGHKDTTFVGYSEQSGLLNSNHDTGYQTCSINNTTNNVYNYSMTPPKKAITWNENINEISEIDGSNEKKVCNWQTTAEIMISSTPSKYIQKNGFLNMK